ncbi:MAG: BrnA antitoxin family protein [Alcanivoracaceae bacterium]|nr:BrnA antitoxin family protein [Alcanivoracaceae bacterium]
MKVVAMRKSYDFTDSIKNPYAKKLKKQITIRLEEDTIAYFKGLAEKNGVPYQSLINLYLRDCAQKHVKLEMKWSQ